MEPLSVCLTLMVSMTRTFSITPEGSVSQKTNSWDLTSAWLELVVAAPAGRKTEMVISRASPSATTANFFILRI